MTTIRQTRESIRQIILLNPDCTIIATPSDKTRYNANCIEFNADSENLILPENYTVITKSFPSVIELNGIPTTFYSIRID